MMAAARTAYSEHLEQLRVVRLYAALTGQRYQWNDSKAPGPLAVA